MVHFMVQSGCVRAAPVVFTGFERVVVPRDSNELAQ